MNKLIVIEKIIREAGFQFSEEVKKKLTDYLNLVIEWSERTNLVSRLDESALVERHVLESLAILVAIEIPSGSRIVDVGSGGGFPSIPVALICSDLQFALVESKRMKALFLREVVSQLELKNVEVYNERVEEFEKMRKWEAYFDFGFSRAVANIEIIYGWIKNIIKPQGIYVAWKGGNVEGEIKKLRSKYPDVFVKKIEMDERFVKPVKKRCFVTVLRN